MMHVDYIIIGQGICGSWLGYYLLKENKKVIIIDDEQTQSASYIAGGLINPVTGRRVVTTWMAAELLPFVWKEYNKAGEELHATFITQKNVLAFPFATDLQQAFNVRIKEQNSYIKQSSFSKDELHAVFNFPFNVFEIAPCYVVNMQTFLKDMRNYCERKNIIMNEVFNEAELQLKDNEVLYKNIKAKKVIYANGFTTAESKFWQNLPFVQNKGQALIIETENLNTAYTYKFSELTLIYLKDNLWWAGSSNELSFDIAAPTEDFKNKTVASLKSILKNKFEVKERLAALRPATVERRPFVGGHPVYKQVAILNGMGSKGCSLAPWFAKQLTENLLYEKPIDSLTDVQRFSRILGRN